MTRKRNVLVTLVCAAFVVALFPPVFAAPRRPNVVFVTIDTLRSDRLSAYGYERETSPNLDRLVARGVTFSQARTVEPLTSPASCSMITGQYPHQHGSTRNGLRMRTGLPSLPLLLASEGYTTAAFVGNWTLRDKLSGLAEHFDHYDPVLTRKRWFGLIRREATAQDLNERSLGWLDGHLEQAPADPFMLWVHYTEPHAPYELHESYLDRLGIEKVGGKKVSAADRYDTEIAFVDRMIGELLEGLFARVPKENLMVIVASDHGESLGEHKYWGHGRNLYEPTLRIPMAIVWEGVIAPRKIEAPALIIDLPSTVAGLLGLEAPEGFRGFDWATTFDGRSAEPFDRVTHYETHRSAVLTAHDSDLARRSGLIAVALLDGREKEIFRVKGGKLKRFDLREDPNELNSLSASRSGPTEALQDWIDAVARYLEDHDDETLPEPLDDESIERLRALGYAD